MILLLLSIPLLYFFYLLLLAVSWSNNPFFNPKAEEQPPVSILIPCRNEGKTIAACLDSISTQRYPAQVEVIVVDDHSEDRTVEIARQYPFVKVLQLPEHLSGKKSAISYAVQHAGHELIITRDADTSCGPEWLSTITAAYSNTKAALLICPVKLDPAPGLFNALLRLEHFALTILTGATAFLKRPILCNGANLCFTKSIFNEVGGYSGNETIASGDDIFLLNKIRKRKHAGIFYLKNREAFVTTSAPSTLHEALQQRLRWAQKSRKNPRFLNTFSSLLIVFCNVLALLGGILSVFYPQLTPYFIFTAILKCFIDFLLLFLAASFYQQRTVLLAFPVMALVYSFYVVWIAIAAYTAKAEWKGRNIN